MKSLKARFNQMSKKHAGASSLIIFNAATAGQKFSRRTINYWFNRLVDRGDYERRDKRHVLDSTYRENMSRTA